MVIIKQILWQKKLLYPPNYNYFLYKNRMTKKNILYYNINDVSLVISETKGDNGTRFTYYIKMLDKNNNRINDSIYYDTNIIRDSELIYIKESLAIESGMENRIIAEASYTQKIENQFATTLNSMEFAVTSGIGKFSKVKKLIIFYNNIMGERRIVLIK